MDNAFAAVRAAMVAEQVRARGVRDPRVLQAMAAVPRHRFVAPTLAGEAYADYPLPLTDGQTISQPFMVAAMAELLQAPAGSRVLEIGAGCGYLAAVLAAMGLQVYAMELRPQLARQAGRLLRALGYPVRLIAADGYAGWREAAPFAGIVVSAAPPAIPADLPRQLTDSRRLVIPVGAGEQRLLCLTRRGERLETREMFGVRFVPLVHAGQRPAEKEQ